MKKTLCSAFFLCSKEITHFLKIPIFFAYCISWAEKQARCMHTHRITTPRLCTCGVKEGTENSVKSWSHQALDWKAPADTSLILTLSCRRSISTGGRRRQQSAEHSLQAPSLPQSHVPATQQPNRLQGQWEAKQPSGARISSDTQHTHGTVTESKFDSTKAFSGSI